MGNMTTENSEQAPAKRGRPKGLGKVPGSGRKKGVPNKTTAQTRERIAKEADPIGLLIQIAKGNRFSAAAEPGDDKRTWVFPSLEQRFHAAQTLAKKVLPDMKAQEISGPDGAPLGGETWPEMLKRMAAKGNPNE